MNTDIPITFRGIEGNTPISPPNSPDPLTDADIRLQKEGWAYLLLAPGEIQGNVPNYIPAPLTEQRFPNADGVGIGQSFQRQGGRAR